MRFIKKLNIIVSILLLIIGVLTKAYPNEGNLVLKINPIKGENYVTKVPDLEAIESLLIQGFETEGYKVYTKLKDFKGRDINQMELLYADVFIYEHRGESMEVHDQPIRIGLIIRNNEGVLFEMEKESFRGWFNSQKTISKITKRLIKTIPTFDNLNKKKSQMSFNPLRINKMKKSKYFVAPELDVYPTNFEVSFKFTDETNIEFIYDESISEYLKDVINHQWFRGKVLHKEIVYHIEINEIGLTLLKKVELPTELNEYQLSKVVDAIKAIPLWLNKDKERMTAKIYVEDK